MLSFIESSIGQRIKYHQDITGLSILLLGGIVALFNVGDVDLVKTSWLLYSAGGFLITSTLIGLFSRVKLLEFLQGVIGDIEAQATTVYRAVKELRSMVVRTNPPATEGEKAIAIDKLIAAENPHNTLPFINKVWEHSHKITALLFASALIQIAFALLIKISV